MRRTGKGLLSPTTGRDGCGGAGMTYEVAVMRVSAGLRKVFGQVFTRLAGPRLVPSSGKKTLPRRATMPAGRQRRRNREFRRLRFFTRGYCANAFQGSHG